jgi:hypothetical protein
MAFRVFRVPMHKLSVSEDQPGSAILQLEQNYVNDVLSAWCDRIASRLMMTFELDVDDFEITWDFEHAIKADLTSRINSIRVGILGSLYTVNEGRAAIGLPPVPGGDTILQPTNVAPLGYTPEARGGARVSRGAIPPASRARGATVPRKRTRLTRPPKANPIIGQKNPLRGSLMRESPRGDTRGGGNLMRLPGPS